MTDPTPDIDTLRKAAATGTATAQFDLAVGLIKRHPGGEIPEEAGKLLHEAADSGYPMARLTDSHCMLAHR